LGHSVIEYWNLIGIWNFVSALPLGGGGFWGIPTLILPLPLGGGGYRWGREILFELGWFKRFFVFL